MDNVYISQRKLTRNRIHHNIIFGEEFDTSLLDNYIKKIIKTLAPVPYAFRGLIPTTNRISHWFITIILDNDSVIVLNSNKYSNLIVNLGRINYKYNVVNYDEYFGIIKHIYEINNPIKLSTCLNECMNIVVKNFNCYTVFGKNNCQHLISSLLKNVFGIDDNETFCEPYNFGILSEIHKNKQHATNFNNITQ